MNWFKLVTYYNYGLFLVDGTGDLSKIVGESPLIIEEDIINFDNLVTPESSLDTNQLLFLKNGFKFKCYCKHTSDEFWSEEVPYDILLLK